MSTFADLKYKVRGGFEGPSRETKWRLGFVAQQVRIVSQIPTYHTLRFGHHVQHGGLFSVIIRVRVNHNPLDQKSTRGRR